MHIYKWTHKETGKTYVGQSIQDPNQRRLEHIAHSRHSEKTYHFHNAIRKYGVDAFDWEVLEYALSIDELNRLEVFYMNKYDSIENGYNLREGGDNRLHSDESKKRMRESQKKAHQRRRENGTEGGWKRKDGGPMKGKTCSEEHKRKVGLANKGKKHSEKTKTKLKLALQGKTWKTIDGKRVWMEKE